MASKEIKGLLKNARESIRNGEFKDALKHCKGVLKLDKNNYNALVFIGVCAKEMNQPEQAQAAYKRAIESDRCQLLAWQGLASLYEKEVNNEVFQADLADVYKNMIDLYQSSDKVKAKEVSQKLVDLFCKQGKHFEAVKILEESIQDCGNSQEKYDLYLKIIAILQEKESEDLNILIKLSNVYRTLVYTEWTSADHDQMVTHHTSYIKVLHTIMECDSDNTAARQNLIDECKAMSDMYPSVVYPLDVLSKIYLHSTPISSDAEVPGVFETLCSLDPCSSVGKIGLGWSSLVKKNYEDSMLQLQQGLEGYSECPTGWLYLSHVQCHFHNYISAEKSLLKGLENLNVVKSKNLKNIISYKLRLNLGQCLYKQGRQRAEEANELLLEIMSFDDNDPEVLTSLGESSLILDDVTQASQYCSKALNIDKTYHAALALQGRISSKEGLFDDAELRYLEAIELCRDCPMYYFLLGQLYWNMAGEFRTDKDKCLTHLLKAAKLDPHYPPTFVYLGHYYREVLSDINKACRCYQKAFDLDDQNDDAGCHLGDLLTDLDREEDALKLFSSVTRKALPGKAKWAWIRLGLYYLKRDQSNEAITCFQSALRGDPKDSHCWECLGESYMSRGSFTAALKAFTRSSELDNTSLYSLYQIAAIKQALCVYQEALEEYQLILDRQPGYVPALKGYGETQLCLARSAIQEDFNKRAIDHLGKGLAALSRAVESRPNMSCLWKLIGDCCVVVDPLPSCMVSVGLSGILKSVVTGEPNEPAGKRKLLSLATSAYGKALKSQPQCSSLWNDLGLSYYLQAKIESGEEKKKLSDRCLQVLKKGLSLDRTNHTLWNSLGVVCASPEVNNPNLSQHAFIMSIKAEPNNPVAWTNLGVLYLKHGKIEPANEAFKNAQALEPSYTTAWVGQASIAETIGHEEAEDLFRHTLELGSNVEGSVGYAHWVCTHLTSGNSTKSNLPIPSLSHLPAKYRLAVTQSSVAMTKYTDRIRGVACAFNLHGLLLEHQCLYKQAEQAFKSSLHLLESNSAEQDFLNTVYINYARILSCLGKYTESIEFYQKVKPLDRFHDICGLALCLYMAGKLPESYRAYEQALQLAASQEDKSCVLTAMGMLGYALNDHDGAKAVLLKSSQLSPPCERGLMALCALGLVRKDMTLAGAALSELLKLGHKRKEAIYSDICFLFSRFFVIQGNPTVGLRHILKAVHEHPDRGNLWEQCTSYMLEACQDDLQAASRCAESTRKLKRLGDEVNVSLQPATLLGSGCVPSTTTCNQQIITADLRTKETLRAAQKAVRAHPDHLQSWGVLCAALTARGVAAKNGNVFPALALALSKFTMSKCTQELKELDAKSKVQLQSLTLSRKNELIALQKWTSIHTGYSMMYCNLLDDAIKHCDQALSDSSDDPQTCTSLHFLKAQVHLCTAVSVEVAMNHLQTSVLSSPYHSPVAWQVLADVHIKLGSPMAAELCYRKCLQVGLDKRSTNWKIVPLLRLGLLALNQAKIESDDRQRWLTLCQEASTEVLKINPDCVAARLIQGIGYHLQGNTRQAKRFLQSSVDSCSSASSIAQYWLSLSGNK